MNKQFLADLINSISPSGYEGPAAKVWKAEAETFADKVWTDTHGNSHAIVNPGGSPRVMFAGHYDEIGFQISYIDEKGFLWIQALGGWDSQIAQGQRVQIVTKKGIVRGVIGKVAIHLQTPDDRKKVSEIKDLWVDIGAKDKEDAEKMVEIGDPMVLAYGFEELANGLAAGRAFDDRAGAFVVLEAARQLSALNPEAEIHAVATVQEEIGLRGATTAAYGIDPDIGIAVDVTFATDHPNMGEAMKRENLIELGKGPVLTRGPNINAKLFELLVTTATEEKIPVQLNAEPRGTGTDANAIQLNRAGVTSALVSIPLRYMHSPCELISLTDLELSASLLAKTVAKITPETNFVPF
ncbi:M42 family metallopeptidase [Pontiella sp.]|uniref:M42 family metallopeptidase n=1 Tax=Pontiella sp. TaxID=2837462 RepID=UPI003565960E